MSLTKAKRFVEDWIRADQGAGASKEVTRELVDAIEELSQAVDIMQKRAGVLQDLQTLIAKEFK